MEKKSKEFLPLLIKRSRIDGRGDDWNHYNGYFKEFNSACTMGASLRDTVQSQFSGLSIFRACTSLNGYGFKSLRVKEGH